MPQTLSVAIGQYSDKGRKELNQDFHAAYVPAEPQLSAKGIVVALADGISSSSVSQVASQMSVKTFLDDYFSTSESWSVKKSGHRVLMATNSWLYSQTRRSQYRYDANKGYVCTFSALIIKSRTAHIFHAGDARIYRLRHNSIEQLTRDHRLQVSSEVSYLSRALGMDSQLELDYASFATEPGDTFLLLTDGAYEFAGDRAIIDSINKHADNLDQAAQAIGELAYANNSDDNITVQILRVDELPNADTEELYQELTQLPFAPPLEPRQHFDGYTIVRQLHASSRSHVYLAVDDDSGANVVIKTPSIDLRDDPAYLERFLMEEWIARRIDSPHVLKAYRATRTRHFVYIVTEYIEGQTLTQWMIDNPEPSLEQARGIIEQIARGLRALHRLEMLHQDLRPANVMIDSSGTVKLIDFGATHVAGVQEMTSGASHLSILGTAQYTAPEYFLSEPATERSDAFSLAVITYQMLTGQLPYGTAVAKATTRAAQNRLKYQSARDHQPSIPLWVDEALRKALRPYPYRRYDDLSEFLYDLRHPNKALLGTQQPPLLARNPLVFWQSVSAILLVAVIVLASQL